MALPSLPDPAAVTGFPAHTAARRSIPLLIVIVLGVSLSLLALVGFHHKEEQELQKEFAFDSENRIAAIKQEVASNVAAVSSLAAYCEIETPRTARQFESFAERIRAVYPTIEAFEWLPRVEQADRTQFEAEASRAEAHRVQITEGRRPAPPVPAKIRPVYYPVRFLTPRTSPEIMGFDVAFEPRIRAALSRAIDSGEPVAAARFALLEKSQDGFGIPIYRAVYAGESHKFSREERRDHVIGFVLAIVQIPPILDRAFRIFTPKSLDFSLYDMSSPAGRRLLYRYRSPLETHRQEPLSEQADLVPSIFHRVSEFSVAGRNWTIVCSATPNYFIALRSWQPFGIFVFLLAATIATSAYLFLNAAYHVRTDRLVAQLYAINANLNEQMQERKKAEAEVSRLNASLESRVHERTDQLRVANAQLILAQEQAERVHQEELRHLRSKQQAEQALRESEQRYALAALGSNDGLWDWNLSTNQVYYSPRWKNMLGYAEGEIGPSPNEWLSRIHPLDVERVKAELTAHEAGESPHFQNEHRVRHSDGGYRWMLARGVAVVNAEGIPSRMAGSQTDITEGKVSDPLTGLRTRLFLIDRLAMAIDRLRDRPEALFALLFIDMDRFKIINDSLGHLAGDQLLMGIGSRLQASVEESGLPRSQVTIARLGGDEFAILLERISSHAQASEMADCINRAMKTAFNLDGHHVIVSASIGVAIGAADTTPEEILRDADTAMYQAKAHGKERYEVFDAVMRTKAVERLRLETELREAIASRQLEVFYQPKIRLKTGAIVEFEALARWPHAAHGYVGPDQFIPVAEETGLIVPLGAYVLQTACQQMAEWHGAFPESHKVGISVNLSTRQFQQKNLVAQIAETLHRAGLPPHCLSLELTESLLMQGAEDAIVILNELRALQIGLKIDDFGTGFSSLNYLHRLPFNELKIDRSFVVALGQQHESMQIVRTIVLLARSLRMAVVAEGVETTTQLEQLRLLGCDFVQGDLFSPPLDAHEAGQFLQNNLFGGLESDSEGSKKLMFSAY